MHSTLQPDIDPEPRRTVMWSPQITEGLDHSAERLPSFVFGVVDFDICQHPVHCTHPQGSDRMNGLNLSVRDFVRWAHVVRLS